MDNSPHPDSAVDDIYYSDDVSSLIPIQITESGKINVSNAPSYM